MPLSTVATSNAITVSGINAAVPISITGGTYSINGGVYTSTAGTVSNGNTVTVHLTSSAIGSTTTSAILTIGGTSGTFNVTTSATFTINLSFTGTGSGSVHSSSTSIGVPSDISCTVGTCSALYPNGNIVKLDATPDSSSTFDGWSGACTTTPCNVTMNATKNVFAAFNLAPMAKNVTTSTTYATLAAALSSALSGDEIWVLDIQHDGAVYLNKAVNLKGGWDATYQGKSGMSSTLNGDFTILGGGSTVETMDVKGKLSVKGGSLRVKGVKVRL